MVPAAPLAAGRGCCRPGRCGMALLTLLPPTAFPDNPGVLSELCSTLSRLAIRNEFCQEVVDLGGLSVLVTLLASCSDHQVGSSPSLLGPHGWLSVLVQGKPSPAQSPTVLFAPLCV
jgi:hypothetical protein